MGVVVFTDLSSSVLGDYRIAAPMQSKTIKRCAWLNWLTQHSHQLGSDIPACFSFFFFFLFYSVHRSRMWADLFFIAFSHLDRPDISDYFECHLNGRVNHILQVSASTQGPLAFPLITVSKEMMCLAIGSVIAAPAHHLCWGGLVGVRLPLSLDGCCSLDSISIVNSL